MKKERLLVITFSGTVVLLGEMLDKIWGTSLSRIPLSDIVGLIKDVTAKTLCFSHIS